MICVALLQVLSWRTGKHWLSDQDDFTRQILYFPLINLLFTVILTKYGQSKGSAEAIKPVNKLSYLFQDWNWILCKAKRFLPYALTHPNCCSISTVLNFLNIWIIFFMSTTYVFWG